MSPRASGSSSEGSKLGALGEPGGRAALDDALLEWMGEADWSADDARFEAIALGVFAHQFAHCEPYARFCRARAATPERVSSWKAIPCVPAAAFKELPLRSFDAARTVKVFRTSGTSNEQRGELHLDTLRLYEASLEASLRHLMFPDLACLRGAQDAQGARIAMRVLAPSAAEAPDSSLSHMFDRALAVFGNERSGHDLRGGALDLAGLERALEASCARAEAVALCGTSFAFVHLLEAFGERRIALPQGSRAMETGGFKGRSRELAPNELRARIAETFGIDERRVVNQYGMTELGSQFYDSVLVDPSGPRRKLGPPWVRVRILDPESGEEAKPGEAGLVAIHDLANTGSVAAIQTADLGRRGPGTGAEGGFEILGRAPGAEARGCSIAIEQLLGRRA